MIFFNLLVNIEHRIFSVINNFDSIFMEIYSKSTNFIFIILITMYNKECLIFVEIQVLWRWGLPGLDPGSNQYTCQNGKQVHTKVLLLFLIGYV